MAPPSRTPRSRDDGALLRDQSSSEKELSLVPTNESPFTSFNEKDSKPDSTTLLQRMRKAPSTMFRRNTRDNTIVPMPSFDLLSSIPTTPAPYLKPLEIKMVAREEPTRPVEFNSDVDSRVDSDDDDSQQIVSPFTKIRTRVKTASRLDGSSSQKTLSQVQEDEAQISPHQVANFAEGIRANQAAIVTKRSESPVPNFIVFDFEQVAKMMAPTNAECEKWKPYLEYYVKGNFTISNPPPAPTELKGCGFLPAMMLLDEDHRLALSQEFDCLWSSSWDRSTVNLLCSAATKRYNTAYASFSIFDKSYEIFKYESGFNVSKNDRSVSIAAHALYTPDIMAIHDTHEDWRFSRNIFVTGPPYIRFFAGAPLLSSSGAVLGVFAVFSDEPRDSFSALDRREMAFYSAELMKDLSNQLHALRNPQSPTNATTQAQEEDSDVYQYQYPGELLQNQVYTAPQPDNPEQFSSYPDYPSTPLRQSNDESFRQESWANSPSMYRSPEVSFAYQNSANEFSEYQSLTDSQITSPFHLQSSVGSLRQPRRFRAPSQQLQLQSLEQSEGYPNRVSAFEPAPMPLALQFDIFEPSLTTNMYAVQPVMQGGFAADQTPPPSRESAPENITRNDSSYLGLDAANMIPDCSFQALPSLADIEEKAIPRPFSSSSLTSFHRGAPNSPDRSLIENELSQHPSIERLESRFYENIARSGGHLSMDNVLETTQAALPLSASITNTFEPDTSGSNYSNSSVSSRIRRPVVRRAPRRVRGKTPENVAAPKSVAGGIAPENNAVPENITLPENIAAPKNIVLTGTTALPENVRVPKVKPTQNRGINVDRIPANWPNSKGGKAARVMIANLARHMHYNIAYLAKVKPQRWGMSDEDMVKPRGLVIEILLKVGNVGSVNLKPVNHLRSLRKNAQEHWSLAGIDLDKDCNKHGCLMAILPDQEVARKYRSSGLVLGVFANEVPNACTVEEEKQLLKDFEKTLLPLIENPNELPGPAPAQTPFFANEATPF